jgi:hypothetical protein
MKYKLLRFSLMSILAMFLGVVYADNVSLKYSGTTSQNMTGENDAAVLGLDATAWSVVGAKGANSNFPGLNKAGDFRLYWSADGSNTITVTSLSGATINSISMEFTNDTYSNVSVSVGDTPIEAVEGIYPINSTSFVIGNGNTSNVQVRIKELKINFTAAGGETDTRAETTVTLSNYETETDAGKTLNLPTVTVKAGEATIEGATVTWKSSNEDVAIISDAGIITGSAGTTTITATYEGDETNYKGSEASYQLTVKGAPYVSFIDMQEGATTTSTPVTVNFSGQQVVFVNGNNAYLADNDGFGLLVYTKNHGLEAGQTLTGSLDCNLTLYQGNAEITGFTAEGLTIGTDDVVPVEKTIEDITKFNQSTLVTIKNVTYSVGESDKLLSDGTNTIVFFDKFKTNAALEEGKAYDVTGIVVLYNDKIEICPRTAEDIVEATPVQPEFRDIKVTLSDASKWEALVKNGATVYVAFNDNDELAPTEYAEEAVATLKGTWHGTSYGWSNFTASVPVAGCVKITYATHDFGNDISVTNAEGQEVAKLNTVGAKWENDPSNVAVTYYRINEPTTLNFSNANYNPYFAVEAIAEADLPEEVTVYTVQFDPGEGESMASEAIEVKAGESFKAPKNYTIFADGKTLTGWNDGTKDYAIGEEITPEGDMTLTAVFTENEFNLEDRTSTVNINFDLSGYNDSPKYKFEGNSGFMVTQATVNGKSIDVKVDIDATAGKFAHNGSGWHQVNQGTNVIVPSCEGAVISVGTYNDSNGSSMTFNGNAGSGENTISYTVASKDEELVIAQISNNYWNSLSITLPVATTPEPPVTEDVTATWDFAANCADLAPKSEGGAYTAASMESNVKGISMDILYNGGQIKNNDNSYYVGNGVEMQIPVKNKGDLVTVKGYPGYCSYSVGGKDKPEGEDDMEYKATATDAEHGYVAVVATGGNNYILAISVTQFAPKGATTLTDEAVTATFPFNLGTEGQKATFSNADYFLNSKVTYGSSLTLLDKSNKSGFDMTRFQPADKESAASEDNAIRFLIQPKFGFVFTPTKVSLKATRFGTNDGKLNFDWQNPDGTTVSLATAQKPNRENGDQGEKYSFYEYEITGATPDEGACGLLINLYGLGNTKQIGFADIVIEGTLSGTEKEVPVLASFKINGTECTADDVFGDLYEAEYELSSDDKMVSAENPLTDVTATSGEIGTITYAGDDTHCTVTIPITAGDVSLDYVLNVVQKPQFHVTFFDLDGMEMGHQDVEKDRKISEFAYRYDKVDCPEGEKVRGWFYKSSGGQKASVEDVVTSDIKLYAVATEIEVASTSKKYNFDLTDPYFYAEDHEAFSPQEGGKFYWHDTQHGWAAYNGDKIDLLVGPKATVSVTLCKYGYGTNILVKKGDETLATLAGMSDSDGAVVAYEYVGEAGTLTLEMVASGEMYIHSVKIVNSAETNYDSEGQWYFAKAGDASSLVDLLDVVNGKNASTEAERSFIYLPNGTYDLKQATLTSITGHNISIIGESQDGVIIKNAPDIDQESINKTATLKNTGTGNYFQDLTIQNSLDYYGAMSAGKSAGRAVCLWDTGTRTVCKNVTLLSYQDTYYTNNLNGEFYWEDSDIHGAVDFICGEGTLIMENSTLTVEPRYKDRDGECTITAASTAAGKSFGYVFNNCKIENKATSFNLGRAWNNEPRVAYLNTTFNDDKLIDARWTAKGMNVVAKEFVEYNSTGGKPVSSNVVDFYYNDTHNQMETILNAEQAANFATDNVYKEWTPANQTAQADAPASATYKNGTVTWDAVDGATTYALFKNGELIAIVEGTSYDVTIDPKTDKLIVRTANNMGGFGAPIEVVTSTTTGVEQIRNGESTDAIYNLQGVRVNKADKGIYIINGKKVVK